MKVDIVAYLWRSKRTGREGICRQNPDLDPVDYDTFPLGVLSSALTKKILEQKITGVIFTTKDGWEFRNEKA